MNVCDPLLKQNMSDHENLFLSYFLSKETPKFLRSTKQKAVHI